MKKLVFAAVACCALATPAFADHINVNVKLTNVAVVNQGGDSHGSAVNNAEVAQGAIATVQAPKNAPVVNTGRFGAAPLVIDITPP